MRFFVECIFELILGRNSRPFGIWAVHAEIRELSDSDLIGYFGDLIMLVGCENAVGGGTDTEECLTTP